VVDAVDDGGEGGVEDVTDAEVDETEVVEQ
jgi:hypothetical protein